ncbi:hypothetical protein WH47_10949 [Habropoda laboriosa]|uniref:Uncharacterized protein n=1 Tax=Habropoda laboriosa TaxID=597456 RepID=A0A0L7R9E8_9HYME|nr:hypothetical protein WH47_10949 [Habropoda laboriosa]
MKENDWRKDDDLRGRKEEMQPNPRCRAKLLNLRTRATIEQYTQRGYFFRRISSKKTSQEPSENAVNLLLVLQSDTSQNTSTLIDQELPVDFPRQLRTGYFTGNLMFVRTKKSKKEAASAEGRPVRVDVRGERKVLDQSDRGAKEKCLDQSDRGGKEECLDQSDRGEKEECWIRVIELRKNNFWIRTIEMQGKSVWNRAIEMRKKSVWMRAMEVRKKSVWVRAIEMRKKSVWIGVIELRKKSVWISAIEL